MRKRLPALFIGLLLGLPAMGLGCGLDLGKTPFLCGPKGDCPDGYICRQNVCAEPTAQVQSIDAGADGAH